MENRILIEGERVQGVGYRLFLLQKALENGIGRIYIRNLNTDEVELLVHDEENKIESFYEIISKEKPLEVEVSSVEKKPYENKIPIPQIDRYFRFLTLEQLIRGKEEIVKNVPEFIGRKMKPVVTALTGIGDKLSDVHDKLNGIDEKLDRVADRFCIFVEYMKSMDEKLRGVDDKLSKLTTLPEKIDTLPDRIAEALDKRLKKR